MFEKLQSFIILLFISYIYSNLRNAKLTRAVNNVLMDIN